MEEEARAKKHTTTLQALELVKATKPWRAVLTHFSTRYQKIAEVLPEHSDLKVMVAFDHMRVSFEDLENAHEFLEIYSQAFKNEKEDEDSPEEEQPGPKQKRQKN